MEITYDGTLVMPSSYAVMDEDEMMYLEGGVAVSTLVAIVGTAIAAGGTTYGAGRVVGKNLYYKGIDTKSELRWATAVASTALIPMGVAGPIFILGMQNQIYDLMYR